MSDKNTSGHIKQLRSRIIKPSNYTPSYNNQGQPKNKDKEEMTSRTPPAATSASRRGKPLRGGRTMNDSAISRPSLGSEHAKAEIENNTSRHSPPKQSSVPTSEANLTGTTKKNPLLCPQLQYRFPEHSSSREQAADRVNNILDQSFTNHDQRKLTAVSQHGRFTPGSMEDLLGVCSVPNDHVSNMITQQRDSVIDPNPGLLAELEKCKQLIHDLLLERNSENASRVNLPQNTGSPTTAPRNSGINRRDVNQAPDPQPQRQHTRNHRLPREEEDSASSSEHIYVSPPRRSPPRSNTPVRYYRRCEMEKWPIKFSSGDGLKFWEKVERCQQTYGYDDETIYKYFYHLVQGQALNWYWQYVTEYRESNLSHLKMEFIRVFKSRLNDATIISDMYNKRQGKDTFEKFYNDLIDMNFTLKQPLPDSQIIEILRNNMDDDIRLRMFTYETRDRVDFFHKANQAFQDVSKLREKRKQFLDYRTTRKISEIDFDEMSHKEIEEISEKFNNWKTRKLQCYNCKSSDHLLSKCPEDIDRLFCFKCGFEGYPSPKCPECMKKNAQRSVQ